MARVRTNDDGMLGRDELNPVECRPDGRTEDERKRNSAQLPAGVNFWERQGRIGYMPDARRARGGAASGGRSGSCGLSGRAAWAAVRSRAVGLGQGGSRD